MYQVIWKTNSSKIPIKTICPWIFSPSKVTKINLEIATETPNWKLYLVVHTAWPAQEDPDRKASIIISFISIILDSSHDHVLSKTALDWSKFFLNFRVIMRDSAHVFRFLPCMSVPPQPNCYLFYIYDKARSAIYFTSNQCETHAYFLLNFGKRLL